MRTVWLSMIACVVIGCVEQAVDEDTSGGDDITWPAPDLCEMRQQAPNGELEAPNDVQAVCDEANTWIAGLYRPASVECTTDPMPIVACAGSSEETSLCESDAACEAVLPGSKCRHSFDVADRCMCILPCTSDADCPSDHACGCRSGLVLADGAVSVVPFSACWPADCRGDDDCGTDGKCVLTSLQLCPGYPHFECQPADAPCKSDLDCLEYEACASTADGWQCVEANCGP